MSIFSEVKIIYIPLLLFPIAIVTGPFLPDLILSFVSIFFVLHLYEKKNLKYLYNDFSKIFFLFYFFLVLSSFLSDNIFFSLKNTFFYFRFLIFSLLLKYLIIENKIFRDFFPLIFLFVLTIVSLDASIEYFRDSHWLFDKSAYPEKDNNRISGLFDEEYILGGFILSFFPIITCILSIVKINKIYLIHFLFLLISLFCFVIIITGERSSFVKLLLVIFSIIFLTSLLGTLRNEIIIFLTFLLGILLIVTYQPKLKENYLSYF